MAQSPFSLPSSESVQSNSIRSYSMGAKRLWVRLSPTLQTSKRAASEKKTTVVFFCCPLFFFFLFYYYIFLFFFFSKSKWTQNRPRSKRDIEKNVTRKAQQSTQSHKHAVDGGAKEREASTGCHRERKDAPNQVAEGEKH